MHRARRARPAADRQAAARGLVHRHHQGRRAIRRCRTRWRWPRATTRRAVRGVHRGHRAHLPGARPGRRRRARCRWSASTRPRATTTTRTSTSPTTPKYLCPAACRRRRAEVQRLTLAAYRALGCRGWGRADLMLRASRPPALPAGDEHQPRHDRPFAGADVGPRRRHRATSSCACSCCRGHAGPARDLTPPTPAVHTRSRRLQRRRCRCRPTCA
jgi:hypothetical protein